MKLTVFVRKWLGQAALWSGMMVIALLPPAVLADEVTMQNGDVLRGTVVEAREGKLFVTTPYADRIGVAIGEVAAVETEEPVRLRMKDRSVLEGRLTTEEGEIRMFPVDATVSTRVPWSDVQSINVPAVLWSGHVHAGATEQAGNTDRFSATAGAEGLRRGLDDRLNFSVLLNYAEEEDTVTTRDAYGSTKYDYFFSPRFYALASLELLHDRFKDLNLRATAGPGVGYQVWEDERKSLSVEAGTSYVVEDRSEADDDRWFTARLAANFRVQLLSWLRFTDALILYPELRELGEHTLRNEAALVTSLDTAWSLRLANVWERDSSPPDDVGKDDLRTSLSVQYSF